MNKFIGPAQNGRAAVAAGVSTADCRDERAVCAYVAPKKGTLSFMNFMYNIVALIVLIVAVCGLYLYRRWLENHDDHYIHLHNDAHDTSIINSQTNMAKRLEALDKLKNAGLAAVILYGLAIAGMAAYVGWTTNPQS